MKQATDPIIIYGPPRSGTTYLGELISKHPDVLISNEYRIFTWFHQAIQVMPNNDDMVLHGRKDFKSYLNKHLPGIIRGFYAKQHPNAKYWGDKNPFYGGDVNRLKTIAEYFPDTKFINIIRDGRDVVVSLMKKKWPDGRPWADFDEAHQVWNSNIETGLEFARYIKKSNHYTIKYEDLITDDLNEAKKLFKFLGIDWHHAVAQFAKDQQEERTAISKPVRDLSDSKKIGESIWADYLTEKQQTKSMNLLQDNMKKLHYL